MLVVDEASVAAPSLLDELRLLANHEDRQDKHVRVVHLGQPELRGRVRKQPRIDQRVSLRSHVEPMEAAEVSGYVKYRLRIAGMEGSYMFTSDAFAALAERE